MSSRFGWLDTDEAQRRQMMEVVDLFKDEGTIDEIGIGTVRDTIANALFPGLSVLHTRLRYVLFVPWLVQDALASTSGGSAQAAIRLRRLETQLIDSLVKGTAGGAATGIIGVAARGRLKRMPSGTFWSVLGRWGVRDWDESIEGYLRRSTGLRELVGSLPVADDLAARDERRTSGFVQALPAAPAGLLTEADFTLTPNESEFLAHQINASTAGSLLAWLVDNPAGRDCARVWDLPNLDEAPSAMVALVDHARRLHVAIHGAPLLYNLMLAEEAGNDDAIDYYQEQLEEWSSELAEAEVFDGWNRADFWATLLALNPRIRPRTQNFVNSWLALVQHGADLGGSVEARELIRARERQIKGARARLGNRAAIDLWSGQSGLVRLDFRWAVAQRMMADLHHTGGAADARA